MSGPGAEVWFNGTPTTSTGPARQFASPPLTPGTRYSYDIRATWNENGREVTQTQQGIAFSVKDAPAAALPWVEGWTFRQHSSLLTFRRSANSGPATELRYDTGGDHFILKRQ